MDISAETMRPERGEETRQKLLAAAVEVFGRLGFEAASTRAIAEAAGANLAAIPYHFGGKEGLYLAAAQYIADRILARLGPALARIEASLAGPAPSRDDDLEMALLLVELMATAMVQPDSAAWARFIMREQAEPTAAFALLYDGPMKRLLGGLAGLLGRLSGRAAASEAVRLRAITVLGQVIALRAARAAVLASLGWRDIGPEEFKAVRRTLRANLIAIVQALREETAP